MVSGGMDAPGSKDIVAFVLFRYYEDVGAGSEIVILGGGRGIRPLRTWMGFEITDCSKVSYAELTNKHAQTFNRTTL